MTTPAILFVRIRTALDADEVERRIFERRPQFADVPGLRQKIFGRDPASGDVCGIYFFDDTQSLEAYRESDLARSIPGAYEALEVRREAFDLLCAVRDDRGPFTSP